MEQIKKYTMDNIKIFLTAINKRDALRMKNDLLVCAIGSQADEKGLKSALDELDRLLLERKSRLEVEEDLEAKRKAEMMLAKFFPNIKKN